jgi:hypothetical protein
VMTVSWIRIEHFPALIVLQFYLRSRREIENYFLLFRSFGITACKRVVPPPFFIFFI